MTAAPEPPDYGDEVHGLLEHAVRDEVTNCNALAQLGLLEHNVDMLCDFLVDRIATPFRLQWTPSWVPEGLPHTWEEAGSLRARCTTCLLTSPALASVEAAATWHVEHRDQAHTTAS